jgi:hypothetical protein
MMYLAGLAALTGAGAAGGWYGPATVTAAIAVTGNPYDPAENDVEADFVSDTGAHVRRLAYYIGDGKFASTLVAERPGIYKARFILNGKPAAAVDQPLDIHNRFTHGFVGLRGRHFAWTDGTPYFPIGYDYAWKGVPGETVAQGMLKMGRSGCNWSRIWADHWDNKNPFWPTPAEPVPAGQLRQDSLQLWDEIIQAADSAGVCFQFTLFHHGPWSTTTDSNWRDNPWNKANGGFLADPTDFFTDAEAKRRTKIWLRYAVARYASSPAVMAWELFNEVQWVDAIKKNPAHIPDVAAWHREMAAYVRSLDPYHHLVTSSSSESLDSHIFDTMDYMQPHTYPANVLASIGGYTFKEKPGFFGEFGPPNGTDYRKLVRDGIYGGILAGHAGAGMYWFWDRVDQAGLADDYSNAAQVVKLSGLLRHLDAKPIDVWADTPNRGEMVLSPGLGWGESTTTEFDLPKVGLSQLAGWSQYFQSLNGKKEWAKPLILKFTAAKPGKVTLEIGQVSGQGGALTAFVNDKQVFDETFPPPTAGDSRGRKVVAVDYPAGPVTVRLENHGRDWVQLNTVRVPDQGPTATAHGLGDRNWALIRLFGSDLSTVRVAGLGLPDGKYVAVAFDLTNGTSVMREAIVHGGSFSAGDLTADCVIDLRKE